jgi:hypothetical protein
MAVEEVVLVEPKVKVFTAAPVAMFIVSAEASSPMARVPVVPLLIVKAEAAAEDRVTAPAPV